jgi:hypothetical protein
MLSAVSRRSGGFTTSGAGAGPGLRASTLVSLGTCWLALSALVSGSGVSVAASTGESWRGPSGLGAFRDFGESLAWIGDATAPGDFTGLAAAGFNTRDPGLTLAGMLLVLLCLDGPTRTI